ncbi:cytochrome c3 family protein [Ferrimonas sp. SCSIO 43195]|uniref:cytochrome c3 family protein n=1 Tax=Ferrimonas sp. SCSIO 43195 TaxID=2822844 RepID=UPI0020758FBD|nr:cytochrome c3 family protein [Ferrimonas sp. SCSIO 43195]USD39081.1 hypothetical protein J8Z22_08280 [Ferrimonas sp. SCSIO 43195]
MKTSKWLISAAAISMMLSGCGSDDDSAAVPVPPEVTPPEIVKPDYVFGGPTGDEQTLSKVIQFAIVKRLVPVEAGDGAQGQHAPAQVGAQSKTKIIPVDGLVHTKMDEQAADMGMRVEYLLPPTAINMSGVNIDTLRPDLFPEGRGSVLDLLLWVGEKYGLDIEIEKDEALNTYFVTSIAGIEGEPERVDQSRLGATEGQGWKYLVGPSTWEAKVDPVFGGGDWNADHLYYKEEEIYFRIDHQALKNEMSIVLMPAQPGEMEVRKRKYRKEMDRLAANAGKVIVPEIVIDFKPPYYNSAGELVQPGQRAVFKDIEVTPHNLRTDLYQPGVITELDAWLSLVEQRPDLKINWSYWPRLSTNANVQGYVATSISFNGKDDLGNIINQTYKNNGECGFVHHTGEWENYADSGAQNSLYEYVMCAGRLDMPEDWNRGACMSKVPGIKGFRPRNYGAGELYENDGPTGYMSFGVPFGANDPHFTGDNMIIYGPEYINYLGVAFGALNTNSGVPSGCDMDSPEIDIANLKDISQARAPLDESHFGWKLPDCSTCHDPSNSHVVAEMDPYECAECHGNNGAPTNHGERYTCGFCHSQTLTKHGNVYGNKTDYYSKDTSFKEPESCLTCHVDQQ